MKKQLFLLTTLLLLLGMGSVRAAEAYAYFDSSDGSLNFCYDNNKQTRTNQGYATYSLNTGSTTPAWNSISDKVKEIYFYNSFANYKPKTCYKWFYMMKNLTRVRQISNLNTIDVTNMGLMFCDCSSLTSLDVSGFNTAYVTNMKSMFEDCNKLTELEVGGWNVYYVTDMSGLFYGCTALTKLNVGKWKTSHATTMRYLFYKCSSLTSLDLSSFNTSNVTSMYYMFGYCTKLATITGLTATSGNQNFSTDNVTTMQGMFNQCSSLQQLYFTEAFKISSSTNTENMFVDCSKLSALNISSTMVSYLNETACKGVGTASSPCTLSYPNTSHPSFATITTNYVTWHSGYFKSSNIKPYAELKDSYLRFYWDDYYSTGHNSGKVYGLNSGEVAPGWHSAASQVTTVTFNSSFAKARPTTTYEWFCDMSNLTTINNIGYLNTSETTTFRLMFSGCEKLTSIDVRNFDTSKATSLSQMFGRCTRLKNILGVENLVTNKATEMGFMFYNCSSLTSLDISKYTISKYTTTTSMVRGCSALTMLTVPSTANNLSNDAFQEVGTESSPCILDYPDGFTPEGTESGNGYFRWKWGYFRNLLRPYAVLSGSTLTFCYDKLSISQTGKVYELNTGANKPGWNSAANLVTTVTFNSTFAKARPKSTYYWFDSMSNLTTINNIGYLNTSETTNFGYMFWGCKKLTSIDVRNFDTSKATALMSMFSSCSGLKNILGVENLVTNKATNMSYMFLTCSSLTSLDISKYTISQGATTTGMFKGCSGLTKLTVPSTANRLSSDAFENVGTNSSPCYLDYPDGFAPEGTESENGYFRWKLGCFRNLLRPYAVLSGSTLTFYYDKLSISQTDQVYELNTGANAPEWYWAASKVTTVTFNSSFAKARPTTTYEWFDSMSNLTTINNIDYLNTSETTNFKYMFLDCRKLTSIDVRNFDTSKATSLNYMFGKCSGLKDILGVEDLVTNKATDMSYMFYNCSGLTSLDISKYTISEDCYTYNMFGGCSALTKLTVPYTANSLDGKACEGVGSASSPCKLVYEEGFKPERTDAGNGWFVWKSGYFKLLMGDANSDGDVNQNDVTLTVSHILGQAPENFDETAADIDGNGTVDIVDLTLLIEMLK